MSTLQSLGFSLCRMKLIQADCIHVKRTQVTFLFFVIFYLRLMQRLVPGASAQPEQHCWPPQTFGLNKCETGWDETLTGTVFKASTDIQGPLHNPQSNDSEGGIPQTFRMTNWSDWKTLVLSFRIHSDVVGVFIRTPWENYPLIAFYLIKTEKCLETLSKGQIHKAPPLYLSCQRLDKDYARHKGHEKAPCIFDKSLHKWETRSTKF